MLNSLVCSIKNKNENVIYRLIVRRSHCNILYLKIYIDRLSKYDGCSLEYENKPFRLNCINIK